MRKAPPIISPKSFLKSRRPERFSDSISKETGKLDRAMLEFQLSTLNKRNLELAFENFAKQLCEKIICPNLLEQTGPVAGGDGKVDTQTFPVSEQTKVLWFIGVNENSDKERWAFAVSTQETWKAKCKKDVKNIKYTDRDYKRIYCITNRYAKSNHRSEVEDSLSKETGIDVIILDISWILDQIFKHGYEQLAIDTLSIDIEWKREVEVGTNDYSKNLRLQDLNKNIRDKINPSDINAHQLDWLLDVAILSKELENPHIETQGLFDRAILAANRFGTLFHQFRGHYQYAWASFWWYEDIALLKQHLTACFDLAKESDQSSLWGDIVTLLGLYVSYSRSNGGEDRLIVNSLIEEAKSILSKISKYDARPSNSLMARAYIEILNLHMAENSDQASDVFSSLLLIVKESKPLIGFSFYELYDLVTELDDVFGEIDSYESLLDYLTDQVSSREGDVKSALLWLKRGARRLDSGEPYQAIKLIGKSLSGLYKKEVKKDFYVALNILASAYEKIGLLWASRANLLLAASVVTDEFWRHGELISSQVDIYIRLAKTELMIGRVNYALEFWALAQIVNSNLEEKIITENDFHGFDAFLSQCFLNTDILILKNLSKLPDLLDKYQLFSSRSMLLYALGYEDIVEVEYELQINQEYFDYLTLVRDTYLGAQVPIIQVYEDRYASLFGSAMGCEINISFPYRSPLVELAETILSVIQGFFSTCVVDGFIVVEPRLDIEITADDDDEISVSHELDDSSSILKADVLCSSFTHELLNVSGQKIIQNWLYKFVIDVFAHLLTPIDKEKALETMFKDDKAMERAVSFGSCFISLQNILGDDAVDKIKLLLTDDNLEEYKLKRSTPWDRDFPKVETESKQLSDLKPGNGNIPKGQMNNENLTHKDIQIQSLLNIRLWDRVKWSGTGFAEYPDGTLELHLLFDDLNAGVAIFNDLVSKLGKTDKSNQLKITIILNINKKEPSHYRVCMYDNSSFDKNKRVQTTVRRNTMTPINSTNLDRFLAKYHKIKNYSISFGVLKNNQYIEIPSEKKKSIHKFNLSIIEAWQIGPNDMEAMAIYKDDDPFIPEDVEDAPIMKTLQMIKGF